MKIRNIAMMLAVATLASSPTTMQAADLDLLQKQVEQLTQTVKELQEQIKQLQTRDPAPPAAAHEHAECTSGSHAHTEPITTPIFHDHDHPWSPTDPIRLIGNDHAYMNISFNGLFALAASSEPDLQTFELGHHDPKQRGFTVQDLEVAFDGAVDPYFKGQANVVATIDTEGKTQVEVEEAFLQTTSLPCNLELKGGQYFSPFGRQNPLHPHAWEFADIPVVHGIFMGPDGLRGAGAQLSYLLATPWRSVLIASVQNSGGETAYSFRNRGDGDVFMGRMTVDRGVRGPADMLFVPRWENSIDLDHEQTLVLGTSAALGPNDTGPRSYTRIYGADMYYKWKSSTAHGGFPFLKWQTEALYREYEAGADPVLPAEVFQDWGVTSQVVWGFFTGWTAGLRGDYLNMDSSFFTSDIERAGRWRVSPNITWYPSEFSKIRLQYNHDVINSSLGLAERDADSVFLQFEFLLGAH